MGLSSGGGYTYAVVSRDKASPIELAGKKVADPSNRSEMAVIVVDAKGAVTGASIAEHNTDNLPAVFADKAGALVFGEDKDAWVDGKPQGSFASYQGTASASTTIPIPGFVESVTRTASGTIWAAGNNWGSNQSGSSDKCDMKGFVARRNPAGTFETITCGLAWKSMRIAALGEDVVVCGSSPVPDNKVLDTDIIARTFVARISAAGKLKWIKAANELGDSACKGVVVTSDGDIVIAGEGGEGFDLTEDAIKKGLKAKPTDKDADGEKHFLERFSPDGARQWGYSFGRFAPGNHMSLAADDTGSVILADWFVEPLQLGAGPVGPQRGSLVAAIDRNAKVTGMLVIDAALDLFAVPDGARGLVIAFPSDEPVKVQGMTVNATKGSTAVVRIPLPLPPPPK